MNDSIPNQDPRNNDLEEDRLDSEDRKRRPFLFDSKISGTACENPAIARCSNAWKVTYDASRARGEEVPYARVLAHEAYRTAMPPLTGARNIRDFIACTGHGMLIGAIDGSDGARLLYAAQVANCSCRKKSSSQKTLMEPNSRVNEPFPNPEKCAQAT